MMFSVPAQAADSLEFCRSPEELAKEIMNCDLNEMAAAAALNCAGALQSKLSGQRTKVAGALNSLTFASYGDPRANGKSDRVERLLREFSGGIGFTAVQTEMIGRYTDAMIDFPEGVDELSSAPCFNSAFNSLQSAVRGLDADIVTSEDEFDDAYGAYTAWKNKEPGAKEMLAKAAKAMERGSERLLASKKKNKNKKRK